MNKSHLVMLTLGTFMAFGILLSIHFSLSAVDQAYDVESQVGDLDYRIENIAARLEQIERERRW